MTGEEIFKLVYLAVVVLLAVLAIRADLGKGNRK